MPTITTHNATPTVGGCNFTWVLRCRESILGAGMMEWYGTPDPKRRVIDIHCIMLAAFQLHELGQERPIRGVLQPISTVLTTGGCGFCKSSQELTAFLAMKMSDLTNIPN